MTKYSVRKTFKIQLNCLFSIGIIIGDLFDKHSAETTFKPNLKVTNLGPQFSIN